MTFPEPNNVANVTPADACVDCCLLITPVSNSGDQVVDFVIDECNEDAARLLGASRHTLQGARISQFLPVLLEEAFLRQLRNAIRQKVALFDQLPGRSVSESASAFRLSATPAGEKLFVILRPLDGPDPVEERFRLAARATNDGFWDWRFIDGDAMWWSVGFYNLLGVRSSETPTWKAFLDRIHPSDRKRFENAMSQQTAEHAQVTAEIRMRAVHNEYRWFRVRAVGRFSKDGKLLRILGAISDIEELKQAELMLRGMNEQLERRVQERTQALRLSTRMLEEHNDYLKDFAGFASHDLREPLRKIRAYGDLLADEASDALNEDARDYLSRMLDAGARMQHLIDDLLIYSRSTGRETKLVPIDLNVLLREVLSDLEMAVRESGAIIELEELPTLNGTPSQFRQLFQNLLANAIKYHEPGAIPEVRVSARMVDLCTLPGSSAPSALSGTFHDICVADDGIGFPQRFAERIFLPFKRLNNRKTFPGSGIGLALCRRVAERHNGLIYARSAPTCGTEIHLILPTDDCLK